MKQLSDHKVGALADRMQELTNSLQRKGFLAKQEAEDAERIATALETLVTLLALQMVAEV